MWACSLGYAQENQIRGVCFVLGFSHLLCRNPWDFLTKLQKYPYEWCGSMQEKKVCVPFSAECCQWAPGLRRLPAFWSTDTEVHDSAWGRDQLPSHCGAGKCPGVRFHFATSAFPGPESSSCVTHSSLGSPISSGILPLLVAQVPVLTLLFRLYRGIHLQMPVHNTGFKSPSLTRNWSYLCHAEGASDCTCACFNLQNSQVTLCLVGSKSWRTVPTTLPADVRLLAHSSFFLDPYNYKGGRNKLICSSCGVADHLRALLVF